MAPRLKKRYNPIQLTFEIDDWREDFDRGLSDAQLLNRSVVAGGFREGLGDCWFDRTAVLLVRLSAYHLGIALHRFA